MNSATLKTAARHEAFRLLFDGEHWCRVEMNKAVDSYLDGLERDMLDAVEISGYGQRGEGWKSFEKLDYPAFDLCNSAAETQFDVVFCEQVLEHVVDPWKATKTLFELTRPGGTLIVDTPFMLRIHKQPGDYWRFTPDGMKLLLERAGFTDVETYSWGNRACVRADLLRWIPYGAFARRFALHWRAHRPWQSLRNEAEFPVMVWAFARRPSA